MPTVSIIVTFHERVDLLRLCLERLEVTTPLGTEIVVVMNNVDRGVVDAEIPTSRARFIRVAKDLGYASAANLGAEASTGELLVFIDHDLIMANGWFESLLETQFRSPSIGATGCKIVDPHTNRILDFGIAFTHFNSPHPHMDQPLDSPLVAEPRRVQAFCTAGFTVMKRTFEALGGFDGRFASLYTDIDFCLRLKEAGLECWVAANSVGYHFGGDVSTLDRAHRAAFLKADLKARFYAEHHTRIEPDLRRYYQDSWLALSNRPTVQRFVACSLLTVADPDWYIDAVGEFVKVMDRTVLPHSERDSSSVQLYPALGYDLMTQRTPILYLVDRFISLGANSLWWNRRHPLQDWVADRNGNLGPVSAMVR